MSLPAEWRARLKLPLIAAPMFLISGPQMVIECCRNGVIGSFPAPNARTPAILEEWLQQISQSLTDADAPWAVNLVVHRTNDRLPLDLELVEKYRPPLVITALGSPKAVIERVQAYGGRVLADVNSLKYAREAAKAGVDGLILVSAGAGGHTGQMNGFAMVSAVREFFDGTLVLGGGLMSGASIRSAELLGADLASMGTRFIPCLESQADARYREMLVTSGFEDLVLSNRITGVPANWLRPSLELAGIGAEDLAQETPIDFTDPKGAARRWTQVWSAGHGVGAIQRSEPARELIAGLAEDYWRAVRRPAFNSAPEAD
ncbi:nitronate monooxygenase [Pseudomonas sp. UL073]|uniref:Nitronate monooxygenase n=1 Tax=Zestomonas insulae TaxID=2809017 RepID=A0ABS2IJV3_9GAMM|nr:nitronate monooxygenase [Pseudomonas insulae]MBM7062968.1 nitronate monooxygenase [Pseudomonas insulae]